MRGVNKVILIGHLGKDPEVQTFEGGRMLAKFSLATTESYKDKTGNKVDKTEWHNITMWGVQADIAQKYLRKGTPIYLEGKISTREYEKDGVKKYFTEIVAETFNMLGGKESGTGNNANENNYSSNNSQSAPAAESFSGVDSPADDLPF
ncbi:MAG: single-strand binding protein [Bacteroidota bacterium]|jgi:single-strand DNA-binding protein